MLVIKYKDDSFTEMISRLYQLDNELEDNESISRTITFQITDDCPMACTYCYQCNKGHKMMSKETAKRGIDLLFEMYDRNDHPFINHKTQSIVLDFIGGEPLMNIEVIDYVCTYFMEECLKRNHPWIDKWRASMISNGALYFNPKVQEFLSKFRGFVSFGITLDGPKEIHDACRIYHDGRGNFDDAYKAYQHYRKYYYDHASTKVTLAPENLHDINKIVKFFVDDGVKLIHANCAFEPEWTLDHARLFYSELKKMADYLLELHDETTVSLFTEDMFEPISEDENGNFCWVAGTPILTTEGYKEIEKVKIGDMVYTEDGTIHPVINTMSHFADNVVEISASGIFKLGCTDNHQLFAKPFNYLGWKGKKHYHEYGTYQVKDLKNKDLIKMFQLPEGEVDYDVNLAYLIGRYIGDGWSTKNDTELGICCSFDEIDGLRDAFKKASVNYREYPAQTIEQFYIKRSNPNEATAELWRILPLCGHKAHGKHLPPECFNWTKQSLKALLQGYMDADGCKKKNGYNAFNTVSYRLAQELMVILRTLGYAPTCYKNNRAGKSIICEREVNIKDRYEVYFWDDTTKSKYIKKCFDGMWTSNLKYKPIEPQMVYNITVEENHSYIAGGLSSKNCGGTGAMLAFDPDGIAYPCLRYMPSSLGSDVEPLIVGDVNGIFNKPEHQQLKSCLDCITRRSQSTDECFYCPVAKGCAWCSAWNYQSTGTPNQRCTNICWMHKARSLANVYYWNKWYKINEEDKKMKMHLPKEDALQIISEEEYMMLLELAK